MNAKVLVILVALVAGAGSMFALAMSAGAREITVGSILRGEWPPEGAAVERVQRTDISVVGYCVAVDRPVGPRWVDVVEHPIETHGRDQPRLRVHVAPSTDLPDEVRVRAWTRVFGQYDPTTGVLAAARVQMKCPSADDRPPLPTPTPAGKPRGEADDTPRDPYSSTTEDSSPSTSRGGDRERANDDDGDDRRGDESEPQ